MQASVKAQLRERALGLRSSLDPSDLERASEDVRRILGSLPEYRDAQVLSCYLAMRFEVRTEAIVRSALDAGKRVLVPVTDAREGRLLFSELRDFDRELAVGHFGVLEPRPEFMRPVSLDEARVIIVPVVAWDERGFRLGYGRGYYDGALGGLDGWVPKVGLALELQRVELVPEEPHDVPLDMIVTERRVVLCAEAEGRRK